MPPLKPSRKTSDVLGNEAGTASSEISLSQLNTVIKTMLNKPNVFV